MHALQMESCEEEEDGERHEYLVPHSKDFGFNLWTIKDFPSDPCQDEWLVLSSDQFGPNNSESTGFMVKIWPDGVDEDSQEHVSVAVCSSEQYGEILDKSGNINKSHDFNHFLSWKLEFMCDEEVIVRAKRHKLNCTKLAQGICGVKKLIRRDVLLEALNNRPLKVVCYVRRYTQESIFVPRKYTPQKTKNEETFYEFCEKARDYKQKDEERREEGHGHFDEDELVQDIKEISFASDDEEEGDEKEEEDGKDDKEEGEEEEECKDDDEDPEKARHDSGHDSEPQEEHKQQCPPKEEFKPKTYPETKYRKKAAHHNLAFVFRNEIVEADQVIVCRFSNYVRRMCEKPEEIQEGMVVIDMRQYKVDVFVPVKRFMYELKWPSDEMIQPCLLNLVTHLEIDVMKDYIDHYMTMNLQAGYSPSMLRVAEEYDLKALKTASSLNISVFYNIFSEGSAFKAFMKKYFDMAEEGLRKFFQNFKFW
ncbi:unnamed protein product [Bursaphelenchus okinawaensis]|uniref:BTB domain-containing protein n=1 Tax=Bursaphelenchus okinawaensis TaxID=465554 RepID=A0A811KQZ7_9BILA|nr:unnamed protein product [Bursaphelenchus okinawaensis]CAG9111072.1 unnamed protein product [Bursaphelenchus okinawaensis]